MYSGISERNGEEFGMKFGVFLLGKNTVFRERKQIGRERERERENSVCLYVREKREKEDESDWYCLLVCSL